MKKIPAIKAFLAEKTRIELAELFTAEMEVQVNVAADGGEKIHGEYLGHKWWGFTDKKETWKPIRIPWRANSENPEYEDSELKFDTKHFEAIGMTGWDWGRRLSLWVGFDFDSIVGHKAGLSDDEITKIRRAVEEVPWVTVRKSTSGKGLHLYIFLEPAIPTANHTEHAALARAILGLLSARVGMPLSAKVDTCGGVLWVWHRRMSSDGYTLVRNGLPLSDVPANWQDHAAALQGSGTRRSKPPCPSGESEALEELVKRTKIAQLDDGHRLIFAWLAENKAYWWWDADRSMMVCHTADLQECHRVLKLKGPFYTTSTGKDRGKDQNCFAFPLRNGAWVVRRHTRRTAEHPAWSIDSGGWTRCYFNCPVNFVTAARCHGGVERPDGRFEFSSLTDAIGTLTDLGSVPFDVPEYIRYRAALLREHKDGRAVLSAHALAQDPAITGWVKSKDGGWWERLVDIQNEEPEVEVPDDFIRHLVAGGLDAGWYIYTRGNWTYESEGNIRKALSASGVSSKVHQQILGQCVLHPWYLVCKPFQPEYPGNRTWNRRAPQFAVDPVEGDWSTWRRVFDHCGTGLKEAVEKHAWCKEFGITSGGDYLFLWAASLLQYPGEPLPYIFFYGPQDSGKSTFHEAISLLFKERVGYVRADVAITSTSRFNAELANAVLCVVEEVNLATARDAYARVKDWVTSRTILVHEKGRTPYELPNSTHWVQTANEQDACPTFTGDTRITMSYVESIDPSVKLPKGELISRLEIEAPAVLYELIKREIPKSPDRLRIPVITSAEKMEAEYAHETVVNTFIRERLFPCQGNAVPLHDIYDAFVSWLPIARRGAWPYDRFKVKLPRELLRGRWGAGGYYHAANIALNKDIPPGLRPLKKVYDKLSD